MEHHWGQRRSTDVTVQIFTRPATTGIGRLLNISSTGAFMETRLPPASAVAALFAADGPAADRPARADASRPPVVRFDGTGVGLEWCEFAAETTPGLWRAWAAGSIDLVDAPQLPLRLGH